MLESFEDVPESRPVERPPFWQAPDVQSEATNDAPDEDAVYRQIGRFVVMFQVLEMELWQLAGYALDPGFTGSGRRDATGLSFGRIVSQTSEAVGKFLDEHRPADETNVRGRLDALLSDCREIARYRNRLVHSAYLFLEAGDKLVGIVRSDVSRGAQPDEVEFDHEALDGTSFNHEMSKIAQTAFGIAQCRLQLIHWYRPQPRSRPSSTDVDE